MTTGLTLGKFAPLHKGHQFVIEQGITETDQLIVLIYDAPEVTAIPLTVRANWIRAVYPQVEVVEAWDGPTEVGNTPEIKKMHEEYILQMLGGRKISHFFSGEFYGEHVSRALGAVDRRVDPSRSEFSVSGTAIRADSYGHRQYLDPRVYRDLLKWVVFLGAPSTGKTTLCETLAERFNTTWIPEYGREYWETHHVDRRLSHQQLLEIAIGHRRREEERVMEAKDFLFIDTDATTTRMFSLYYHGVANQELEQLADETIRRYDLFFLCEDDIPYDDTWDRSGECNRSIFQKQIRADLLRRGIPFITLRGSRQDRMAKVTDILGTFDKWFSLSDSLLKNKNENKQENWLLP